MFKLALQRQSASILKKCSSISHNYRSPAMCPHQNAESCAEECDVVSLTTHPSWALLADSQGRKHSPKQVLSVLAPALRMPKTLSPPLCPLTFCATAF